MRANRLVLAAAASASLLVMTLGVTSAAAAGPIVECGQLSGYTAPDSSVPTDGSLQIGLLPAWDILATAVISPAATTALPNIVNSGPTCLALDLDVDGKITSVDFAAQGTIAGPVGFDTSSGFYIFDDRLIIPQQITDLYPGLGAIFATSHEAGTNATVTFSVDTESGQFVGFDGHAAFCGKGSVDGDGNGVVGAGVIPAAVLDAKDLAALNGAGKRQACAAVHSVGTIDNANEGAISITTSVVITVAAARPAADPTAPPTSVAPAIAGAASDSAGVALAAFLVLLATTIVWTTRRLRSATRVA